MNTRKMTLIAVSALLALGSSGIVVQNLTTAANAAETSMPANAADYAAQADKYEQEAADLERKAEKHDAMAKEYRARYSGGSKQAATLLSLAQHCEQLAKMYRSAAAEARELAKSNREMSKA